MNAAQLRSWLMPVPRPTTVRVRVGKETHEISPAGQTWASIAKTIVALEPERIEALDAEGKVLRVMKPQDEDDDGSPKPEAEETPKAAMAHAYDPETVRFELVAKLLADAYRHSTDVAFSKIVDIVNAQNRRAESLERSVQASERMLRRQLEQELDEVQEAREEAEKSPLGGLADLAKNFMAGNEAGGAAAAATTNGKGKH